MLRGLHYSCDYCRVLYIYEMTLDMITFREAVAGELTIIGDTKGYGALLAGVRNTYIVFKPFACE